MEIKIDSYGNAIITVGQAIEVMLRGQRLDGCIIDENQEVELFNLNSRLMDCGETVQTPPSGHIDAAEYHKNLSSTWYMPDKYKNTNVEDKLLELVHTDEERARISHEMTLYRQKGLEPLLQLVMYLVDTMRQNKIVWGVGRGSSVSSFVLYVIGLNRINPMIYDLKVEEFLK